MSMFTALGYFEESLEKHHECTYVYLEFASLFYYGELKSIML